MVYWFHCFCYLSLQTMQTVSFRHLIPRPQKSDTSKKIGVTQKRIAKIEIKNYIRILLEKNYIFNKFIYKVCWYFKK